MKTILIIGFIFIYFAFSSPAQRVYSKQNLEQASTEDLNHYLKKAKSKKTLGIILTAVGPVTYLTLLEIANSDNSNMDLGTIGGLMALGTICTVVGITEFVTGSTRVNRIKKILPRRASIDIVPYSFQNSMAQNHQYGITLRIRL